MNYPLLAMDAASGQSFACLLLSDKQVHIAQSKERREHSQSLMPTLESLLNNAGITWKDLNMLALGIGPGSFTGLRIAASAFAGINASLQLPMLGISSLAITALQSDFTKPLFVLEDARAGEVFMGLYNQGKPVNKDVCINWSALTEEVQPSHYTSVNVPPITLEGWQRVEPVIGRAEALAMASRHALASEDLNTLPNYTIPAYLQISQAERNLSI